MPKIALYAASFDPPTLGHLDIIRRAAKLVDHLIVAVAVRLEKRALFKPEERAKLLQVMTKSIPNVEVVCFSRMTTAFAKEKKVQFLIRGLRMTSSIHDEFQMALANRRLSGLETLFVLGDENLSHISSTIVKEIATAGGKLKEFLSKEVEKAVLARVGKVPTRKM